MSKLQKDQFVQYVDKLYKHMIDVLHELDTKGASMIVMWLSTSADRLIESEWRLFCAINCNHVGEYETVLSELARVPERNAREQIAEYFHRARFRLKDLGCEPQPQDAHNAAFTAHNLSALRQSAFKRVFVPEVEARL
ncbi:MAG: hypothetical protein EBU84_18920 [Actinobacteria bacterium]|nr:hypothetical protein [Actinomycetota bacterium]